jgi:hypothetical protein
MLQVYPERAPDMILTMNSQLVQDPYIAGYPDRLSFLPGEEISFACSTKAGEFSAEIARVGGTPR